MRCHAVLQRGALWAPGRRTTSGDRVGAGDARGVTVRMSGRGGQSVVILRSTARRDSSPGARIRTRTRHTRAAGTKTLGVRVRAGAVSGVRSLICAARMAAIRGRDGEDAVQMRGLRATSIDEAEWRMHGADGHRYRGVECAVEGARPQLWGLGADAYYACRPRIADSRRCTVGVGAKRELTRSERNQGSLESIVNPGIAMIRENGVPSRWGRKTNRSEWTTERRGMLSVAQTLETTSRVPNPYEGRSKSAGPSGECGVEAPARQYWTPRRSATSEARPGRWRRVPQIWALWVRGAAENDSRMRRTRGSSVEGAAGEMQRAGQIKRAGQGLEHHKTIWDEQRRTTRRTWTRTNVGAGGSIVGWVLLGDSILGYIARQWVHRVTKQQIECVGTLGREVNFAQRGHGGKYVRAAVRVHSLQSSKWSRTPALRIAGARHTGGGATAIHALCIGRASSPRHEAARRRPCALRRLRELARGVQLDRLQRRHAAVHLIQQSLIPVHPSRPTRQRTREEEHITVCRPCFAQRTQSTTMMRSTHTNAAMQQHRRGLPTSQLLSRITGFLPACAPGSFQMHTHQNVCLRTSSGEVVRVRASGGFEELAEADSCRAVGDEERFKRAAREGREEVDEADRMLDADAADKLEHRRRKTHRHHLAHRRHGRHGGCADEGGAVGGQRGWGGRIVGIAPKLRMGLRDRDARTRSVGSAGNTGNVDWMMRGVAWERGTARNVTTSHTSRAPLFQAWVVIHRSLSGAYSIPRLLLAVEDLLVVLVEEYVEDALERFDCVREGRVRVIPRARSGGDGGGERRGGEVEGLARGAHEARRPAGVWRAERRSGGIIANSAVFYPRIRPSQRTE
ncbi:hypothetical protein C8R44DRAFT_738452 [Mycena epipterygia]|nr:hypothetical protein C8R44DRAFT_738452 [Mycena epipterygia]